MSERVAVLVVGMHRSGTSALTRAIGLCGAALPRRLMAPGQDNRAGFWEPAAIVALHEAMLARAGCDWRDVLARDWRELAGDAAVGASLGAALAEDFGAADMFVVKDPRLCRLLPVWLPVLAAAGIAPRVVLAVRHPAAVAASLAAREGMGRARAKALWLRYFLDAERASRDLPRVFVNYDTLLADPVACLEGIGAALAIDWKVAPARAGLAGAIAPGLRHHGPGMACSLAPAGLAALVGETWAWAAGAARGEAADPAVLDRVAADMAAAEVWLGEVVADLQDGLAEADRQLDAWEMRCLAAERVGALRRAWRIVYRAGRRVLLRYRDD